MLFRSQGSLELLLFAEEGEEVVVAAGAAAGHLSCWVLLLARGCELLPIAEGEGGNSAVVVAGCCC